MLLFTVLTNFLISVCLVAQVQKSKYFIPIPKSWWNLEVEKVDRKKRFVLHEEYYWNIEKFLLTWTF